LLDGNQRKAPDRPRSAALCSQRDALPSFP
jgi:hypothetical protein